MPTIRSRRPRGNSSKRVGSNVSSLPEPSSGKTAHPAASAAPKSTAITAPSGLLAPVASTAKPAIAKMAP